MPPSNAGAVMWQEIAADILASLVRKPEARYLKREMPTFAGNHTKPSGEQARPLWSCIHHRRRERGRLTYCPPARVKAPASVNEVTSCRVNPLGYFLL
jgi:hypothetical protein